MHIDEQQVIALVKEVLDEQPRTITRQTLSHSGNQIYEVDLPSRPVIVRLRGTDKNTFSKTQDNLRALKALDLPVRLPEVIAADISLSPYPFRYLILEKIPGRDLLYELPAMTPAQIDRLAEHIVAVQRKVATLPQGTGFGFGHVGEGGTYPVWFDVLPASEIKEASPYERGSSALGSFPQRLHQQRIRLQLYFKSIEPICFLEDLTTKNVLLSRGELQGLIDFDSVCFGDPLWMVGLTAGCIVNDIGREELTYIEALCKHWTLTPLQRDAVAYYAAKRALEFLEWALFHNRDDSERLQRLEDSIEQWLVMMEQTISP